MRDAELTAALADLEQLIAEVPSQLVRLDQAGTATPSKPGGWSARQELGHCIDSALNNLQRIVRLQQEPELRFPGYDGDAWVALNAYQERAWDELVHEWQALNRHVLHAASGVDADALAHVWLHGTERLTLRFIIVDYVHHLRSHLVTIVPALAPAR